MTAGRARRRAGIAATALTSIVVLSGCAADPGSFNIAGNAVDGAGRPAAGCTVIASGRDGQTVQEVAAVTGDDGGFEYPLQHRGRYRVTVTCDEGRVVVVDEEAGSDDLQIVVSSD